MSGGNARPQRFVDEWTLRQRFNEDRIIERLNAGKLRSKEVSRRLGGSHSGQPQGTETVMEKITTHDALLVALVHFFERPDGSRTPADPKYVVVGTEIWKLKKAK